MKALLLAAFILSLTPIASQAQPVCYWQNQDGSIADLTNLCGTGSGSVSAAAPIATTPHDGKQAALAYAVAFCDARKDNYPRDVAKDRAITQFMNFGGEREDISQALADVERMCPALQ